MKTTFTLICSIAAFLLHAQTSVKTFGAIGDGIRDDGNAIQAALNSGKWTIYFEAGKTYITNKPLVVPSNVTIVGNGATLKPGPSFTTKYSHPVITTANNKTDYSATGISISITKGSSKFSYSKASSLKAGSIVWLAGPQYIAYGDGIYTYGWYGTIESISGTTVTMNTPSTHTYKATAINQYVTTRNVAIKGLNVNLKGRKLGYGIGLINAVNSSVSACFVEGSGTTTSAEVGINASGINLEIRTNKVRNMRIGNSIGYGINVSGHNIRVKDNDVAVARHCITSAERFYMSTNITFSNNKVDSGPGAAPLDFHGNTSGTIDLNTIYSTTPNIAAVMVRNGNTVVSNNTITMTNASGTRIYGVALSENGFTNVSIIKNKIYFKGTRGAVYAVADFSVSGTVDNLRIAENYSQGGISLNATLGTVRIDSNTFEGNTIYNPTIFITSKNVKAYYIEGNTFINKWDSRFNYVLSTTTSATAYGYIRNNTVRCTNASNLTSQFRLNNIHNVVENNIFYTQYKYPLLDYTSSKENWLNTNKAIETTNKSTQITYTTLPVATSWFIGRSILYTDKSTGVTSTYVCIKIGTSAYTWQKQSSYAL